MLNIEYPMLFRLYNEHAELSTHSGVLEFVAEEGRVYLPNWVRFLHLWICLHIVDSKKR